MKVFSALCFAIVFLPTLAQASFVIPDLSKNQRSIHSSSAASAWSQRKTVGFDYLKSSSESDQDGTKSEEAESTEYNSFAFLSTESGFTGELQYANSKEETEDFNPAAAKDTEKVSDLELNLGYKLPTLPLAIGFGFNSESSKEKDGSTNGTDKTDIASYQFSSSYKLDSGYFIGAGVTQHKIEDKPSSGSIDKDTDDSFFIGAGLIKGDESNPEVAGEVVFVSSQVDDLKFKSIVFETIINHNLIEFTVGAALVKYDGSLDGSGRLTFARMDYQTGDFYVAPEIVITSLDVESSSTEQEVSGVDLALEGGIRINNIKAYLMLGTSDSETDQTRPSVVDEETDGREVGFGLSYNF